MLAVGSGWKRGSCLRPQVPSVLINLKSCYWAVKVSLKERFLLSSLTIQCLDFGLSYAKNGELLKYIRKIGSFDETCTRFYTAEMVSALEYLHGKGIIHRYQARGLQALLPRPGGQLRSLLWRVGCLIVRIKKSSHYSDVERLWTFNIR